MRQNNKHTNNRKRGNMTFVKETIAKYKSN